MKVEKLSLPPLMRLELFVASLLPAIAILSIGIVGTHWLIPAYARTFIIILLLCTLALFFAEFTFISFVHETLKKQCSDLITVCQDYQAGNKQKRAQLQGGQDLITTLAQAINTLLDFVAQQEKQQLLAQKSLLEKSEQPYRQRLKQLAHEIAPVMDADLRQKIMITDGDLGVVIDACNYLIEGFVQQIKWTRQASEQVIKGAHEMVACSLEFAQTIETQMKRLSGAIETGEKSVAFVQRLSDILQLCINLLLDMQAPQGSGDTDEYAGYPMIIDSTSPQPRPLSRRAERLNADMQQQVQLLEEALQAIQEHTVTAESMIADLYSFAQHIDHSSSSVLSTAEHIGSLATHAERWRASVAMFLLPTEAY
ncbi:MAG TPA: hypothetical protein VFA10_14700 [Ktedonobacteraceae bacterium]|nr:hypothetical protein [Ktedonobacteraceae bacterium]